MDVELAEIERHIEEIKVLVTNDESLKIILDDLEDCRASLLKASTLPRCEEDLEDEEFSNCCDSLQQNEENSHHVISPSSSSSDMSCTGSSDDETSNLNSCNEHSSKEIIKKKKKKNRRKRKIQIKPWIMINDSVWSNDPQYTILQEKISKQRQQGQGLDADLVSTIWSTVLTKYVEVGQIVGFCRPRLNGGTEWHLGVVHDLNYSSRFLKEEKFQLSSPELEPSSITKEKNANQKTTTTAANDDENKISLKDFNSENEMKILEDSEHELFKDEHHSLNTTESSCNMMLLDSVFLSYATPEIKKQLLCRDASNCNNHKCPFSHYIQVQPKNIRPIYWDPMKHMHVGDNVIFLPHDGHLWIKGEVIDILWENDTISSVVLKCLPTYGTVTESWKIEDCSRILPILKESHFWDYVPGDSNFVVSHLDNFEEDGCLDKNQCSDTPEDFYKEESTSPDDDDSRIAAEKELNDHNCPEWFGLWEKYTSGFGSKMLKKMGYKMGAPLKPPSWKPGQPEPLREPIPIRLLPQRVALDYIHGKGKRGGEKVLIFNQSGYEEFEEEQRKQKQLEATCGAFGLINSEKLSLGYSTLQKQKQLKEHNEDCEHEQTLLKARRCSVNNPQHETKLRANLLRLEGEIKHAQRELGHLQNHCARHQGKKCVSVILTKYITAVKEQEKKIQRLEEQKVVIINCLNANQNKAKLNIF